MDKKIVGVVPYANLFKDENIYHNEYPFGNNYMNRIKECGGIPVGVLPANGYVEDEDLQLYDCFIITGGDKTDRFHLQVIDYAIKHNKPLLGICLGLQAIYIYFELKEEIEKNNYNGTIIDLFDKKRKNKQDNYLERIDGHAKLKEITYENMESAKHSVILDKDSVLYDIYKQEKIFMPSAHEYRIRPGNSYLKVTGLAEDGTIEAAQYNKKIFGVQFHPENEIKNDVLFRYLINQCKK